MADPGDCYFHSYNLKEAILKKLKVEKVPVPFLNYQRTGKMDPSLKKKNKTSHIYQYEGQLSIIYCSI